MNIFVLDEDPVLAAQYQCNKHVVKMITESVQLLCTAFSLQGVSAKELPYKPTHKHHPCTLWLLESTANVSWLYKHASELASEYTRRYKKIHKSQLVLEDIVHLVDLVEWQDHTRFKLAIKDKTYHDPDPVIAYRAYYIGDKSRFARWSPVATPPSWWPFEENRTST